MTEAAALHFAKKGYGVFTEIGIAESAWHKRRVDVYGVNLRSKTIAVEIKSCLSDFKSDSKYESYLPYCHQFYFCVKDLDWIPQFYPRFKELGIGVLVLTTSGFIKVVLNAKKRKISKKLKNKMICRLAWRAAEFSKRNSRRKRIYITEEKV